MAFVRVNDTTLYYQLMGNGKPLIFISGLGLDHATWLPVLDEFTQHHQVLIFDNRGVGQSDTPDHPYTIEMMAEDTFQLMQALQIEKADIVGHSMGGAIAQNLAIKYPQVVDRLVLYASAAKMPARSTLPFTVQFHLWQQNTDMGLLIRNILPWLYSEELLSSSIKVEAIIEMMKNYPYPQTIEGFHNQALACQALDLRKVIHKIQAQTLVLAGEDDIALPVNESMYLAEQIPNATLTVLAKMAHVFHLEQPQQFTQAVKEFFAA